MNENPLVGTWQLVSFELRDEKGSVTLPFGEHPAGFITYGPDGRMAVQFGRADRPRLRLDDWLAAEPQEILSAAGDFYAYGGTYEYREGAVLHHIDVSLMPNWIGSTQRRLVALGADTVTLSTPPGTFAGQQQVATLVWRRIRGTEGFPVPGDAT